MVIISCQDYHQFEIIKAECFASHSSFFADNNIIFRIIMYCYANMPYMSSRLCELSIFLARAVLQSIFIAEIFSLSNNDVATTEQFNASKKPIISKQVKIEHPKTKTQSLRLMRKYCSKKSNANRPIEQFMLHSDESSDTFINQSLQLGSCF